jgi:hypothetical protein
MCLWENEILTELLDLLFEMAKDYHEEGKNDIAISEL